MGSNYLMKYKGKYRLMPELDVNTNDIPRNADGTVADGYDDIYIDCKYGVKIFAYGLDINKRMLLFMFIPSIRYSRSLMRRMKAENIEPVKYIECEDEAYILFKSKNLETIAAIVGAKTLGANISPFSTKALPKNKNVSIPYGCIEEYKEITSQIPRNEISSIKTITSDFLSNILELKYMRTDHSFNYKNDMKKMKLSRQTKEYIYAKGMWDEYLDYLRDNLNGK